MPQLTPQVSIRNGFKIVVDKVDAQTVGGEQHVFMVSSHRLADTARPPVFTSDLSRSFYIGIQAFDDQPLKVTPLEGSHAHFHLYMQWCSDPDSPPSNPPPSMVTRVNTTVALSSYASEVGTVPPRDSFEYTTIFHSHQQT